MLGWAGCFQGDAEHVDEAGFGQGGAARQLRDGLGRGAQSQGRGVGQMHDAQRVRGADGQPGGSLQPGHMGQDAVGEWREAVQQLRPGGA